METVKGKEIPKDVSEKQLLQQAAQIQQRNVEKTNERLQNLMSGKASPPNDFVRYMIDKFRETQTELESVQNSVQELSKRLKAADNRAITLVAQSNKYLADIQEWDRPLNGGNNEEVKNG